MTVAISLVVLLGMVALTVDVGGLYVERRKLQNSADAAALAVAIDCAGGDCGVDPNATASNYALENNPRGASIQNITPWPLTPAAGTVTVDVSSGDEAGNASPVRNFFAPVVERLVSGTDDPESANTMVGASATAVWGPVGLGSSVLPFTMSLCDFMGDPGPHTIADLDTQAASLPTVQDVRDGIATNDEEITLHDAKDDDACTVAPGFSGEDESKMPGGFGWLDLASSKDGCQVDIAGHEDDGQFWVPSKEGGASDAHKDCVVDSFERGATIPIFTGFVIDNPSNLYRLYAPAAFYITGIEIPGVRMPSDFNCDPSKWCVYGHFVQRVDPGAPIGGGPSLGVTSVKLSE